MKLKESLVTVVLPVYNAGSYLADCMESIAAQSYKNIEIIAVNDFSKDSSYKILRDFKKKFKNIQIINNKKHYGTAICLNRAMRKAAGQFVIFVNPYDIILSSCFKKQVKYLSNNPKAVGVGSQFTTIDAMGKKLIKSSLPLDHESIKNLLITTQSLMPETVLINRMVLPKDILYFKTGKHPFLYKEVFIKIIQFGKITNINQSLYYHRVGMKKHIRRQSRISHATALIKLVLNSRSSNSSLHTISSSYSALKSFLVSRPNLAG